MGAVIDYSRPSAAVVFVSAVSMFGSTSFRVSRVEVRHKHIGYDEIWI